MGSSSLYCSIVFLGLVSFVALSQGKTGDDVTKILDRLFDEDKYDKRVRPNYGKEPLTVQMDAYILDLFNVDEQNHEFSVNMYLRQTWTDPRLTYQPPPGIENVMLDPDHAKKLWSPDTFVPNERKMTHHNVGGLQELTRIKPDGEILRSQRLTICGACKMSLSYYPFDRQLCVLEFESYGSSTLDVKYAWRLGKSSSVGISQEASSLKYSLTGYNLREETVALSQNYSRLAMEFFLVRNSAREVQDRYFPAFILTLLSFFTLFIGTFLIRTQLSLAILATLVIFMGMNSSTLPKVSYQTALDLYIFACFLTIVNVVVVNFLMQYFYKPVGRKPTTLSVRMQRLEEENHVGGNGGIDDMKDSLCSSRSLNELDVVGEPQISNKFEDILHKVIIKSKYTIPIGYLAFNIIYWMVVLIGSSFFPEDFLIREIRD